MGEENSMRKGKCKKICVVVCVIFIILSVTLGAKVMNNPSVYKGTIDSLDKKTETVIKLTGLATATSAAITALPGDTGTTIADHLMDMNSGLLIVLVALFIEKYMLTLLGMAVPFIIAVALLFIILGIWRENRKLASKSGSVIVAAVLLIIVIPAGVWMSDEITRVYGINLDEVVQSGEEAKNLTEDTAKSTDEPEEEQNIRESIASVISDLKDMIAGLKDMVAGAVTGALDKATDFLKQLTESLAVLIVTTCVIPIVTLIGSLWIIKWIIGVDFVGKLFSPRDGLSPSQKKTFRRAKDM